MTSWSVVRSISAIRSTSIRARASIAPGRLGRDQAARRLGPGHGQLDPEHLLEARRVGPDRAHLGQRVAADHRRAPTGRRHGGRRRRCRGGAAAPATDQRRRRELRRRVAPARSAAPADDGQDAPAGRPPGAVRIAARAGMEDERARRPASSSPSIGVAGARPPRVASRRQDDRRRLAPGSVGQPPRRRRSARAAPRESPRAAASSSGPSAPPSRGRIAWVSGSPKRALNSSRTRPVRGQHQPGVQGAAERRPAPGQLGQDRPVEASTRIRRRRVVGQVRQRAVGPHAAGVRPGVAVERAACGRARRQGHGVAAVADRDDARLGTGQPLLDDAPCARRIRARTGWSMAASASVERVADGHALAGRQAVGLDHDAAPVAGQLGREARAAAAGSPNAAGAGHRDAGRLRDLVAERLARFDPRRGLRRPEDRRPRPRAAHRRRRRRAAPRVR